jgi:hypothetical protein
MRRLTTRLLVFVATVVVPTTAHAGGQVLDPDGQNLTATVMPWIDSLVSLSLTYLGI